VEAVIPAYLWRYRAKGEYAQPRREIGALVHADKRSMPSGGNAYQPKGLTVFGHDRQKALITKTPHKGHHKADGDVQVLPLSRAL
jgi:hypothetical protein